MSKQTLSPELLRGRPSFNSSVVPIHSPQQELRDYCALQAEQLLMQQPIISTCIVYRYGAKEEREWAIYYAPEQPTFSAEVSAILKSEAWLDSIQFDAYYSELNSRELALNKNISSYVYFIDHKVKESAYLLIFTDKPLPQVQQVSVNRCVQMISKYLDIHQKRMRQQAEIQLLEQIIQKAAHQLRNPLALVGLYAENLRLSLSANTLQEQANIICETLRDLDHNLNDLIYCGQRSKLRFAVQDLRAVLQGSINGLRPLIDQKNIHITYPEKSINLMVDHLQIKQVFDNLLSNAVHFSPEAGQITCYWSAFQHEVLIEIHDQGPGLSEEDLQQIFTPFYSRRPQGTGLGLSIAQKIVLDHQGSIWAQNLPGGGAQFSITLPRSISS
ncbi:MAG: HAMP domain-containing sensor histidine kinase [Gloeobacterales cyanobacterium]